MTQRQALLRLAVLDRIYKIGRGHSGRILSSLDLMEGLYFGEEHGRPIFKHDPDLPQWEDRDFFVLSKVEAWPGLCTVLEQRGFNIPETLPDFPDRRVPGVEVSAREHAYGISVAVGMAQAIQMDRRNRHVFCLAGDYELNHGQAWESILTAAEQRLDRLCLVVDENDPRETLFQERFESFGWKVIKLKDAHDHDEIAYSYMKARITQRVPVCIWAPTVKSKGIPFAEQKPEYDDVIFSAEEMNEIRHLLV